jgi:hypothetical protein
MQTGRHATFELLRQCAVAAARRLHVGETGTTHDENAGWRQSQSVNPLIYGWKCVEGARQAPAACWSGALADQSYNLQQNAKEL